jgi:PKD repeat protein
LCVLLGAMAVEPVGSAAPGTARAAATPPWLGLVANNQSPRNAVATFDPVAGTRGGDIAVSGDNTWVGVSPDAAKAYASLVYPPGEHSLKVIDIASRAVVDRSGATGGNVFWGAVTPDGRTAYLSGSDHVVPIDLTAGPPAVEPAIPLAGAAQLALTPDGRTAWVVSGGGVVPLDLTTKTAGTAIATGTGAAGVAASPEGSAVWVANSGSQTVSRIDATTKQKLDIPIAAGHPQAIAVSPDGSKVWLTLKAEHMLTSIDTADDSAGTAVDTGTARALALAIAPDGRTAFVSDASFDGSGSGSLVVPVDLTTEPPTVKTAMSGFQDPVWIAITPDQAPVADFTVTSAPAGLATAFDASISGAPSTSIVSYAWDFGDGARETTTGPRTTHVYAQNATYQASVTETDAAGTSTTRVYTGQQVLRNGGPSAGATKSVVIAAGPQPQARFDATRLDFDATMLGRSTPAQAATLTNSGAGPLHVGAVGLAGPAAAQFRIASDGCGGVTVAPGQACTVGVAFAPTAAGPASGSLAVEDDASGSPHTVALDGVGVALGTLGGRVQAATAGRPALAGASVSACPQGGLSGCRTATTTGDGLYFFGGLRPGRYALEVNAPAGDLFPASAIVTIRAGDAATKDFVLGAPKPLSDGLAVNGVSSGTPVVNWATPFTLSVPAGIPARQPAGTTDVYTVAFGIGPASSADEVDTAGLARTGIALRVVYGADGRGSITKITDLGQISVFTAKPVFQGSMTLEPALPKLPVPVDALQRIGAVADTQAQMHGAMQVYVTRVHAFYRATGRSTARAAGGGGGGAEDWEREWPYGPAPGAESPPPPPSPPCASLDGCGVRCPIGTEPIGGVCGAHDDDRTPNDPEGHVVTRAGAPVAGATASIQRADTAAGPFRALRDRSAFLAAWTPHNPERTDAVGHFSWDVFHGFYRVRATHPRCRGSATSRVYQVPPPALGLRLVLRCPGIHRTATVTRLRSRRIAGGAVLLTATVHGRGRHAGRPQGVATFRSRGRTIGTAPVNARTGTATLTVRRRAPRVSVAYSGDGRFAASRSGR